jgi:hypothetical protein
MSQPNFKIFEDIKDIKTIESRFESEMYLDKVTAISFK